MTDGAREAATPTTGGSAEAGDRPTVETVDYAYHRLARTTPSYRWWKQLIAAVIGVIIYILMSIVVGIAFIAIIAFAGPGDPLDRLQDLTVSLQDLDLTDPATFALATGSIALLLPAVYLARLIMGPRPVGLISSVAGRLRWRWLGRCVLLAIGPFAVVFGLSVLIPSGSAATTATVTSTTALLVVLALVLTPLQAAAEEYAFRGFLMQAIGGWLRHPAFAILIPAPLFALGHTQYGFVGLLDVGLFGIAAAYLTWRTGGLEAAIVAHVINNTTLFVLGAFGLADNGEQDGSFLGVLSTAVIMGSYTALVVWQTKRTGLATTRTVFPPEPPPEHWAPAASTLGTAPGRETDVPAADQSPQGWPPPPPTPYRQR